MQATARGTMEQRLFCSIEACEVGEFLCGTAPERGGVVLFPMEKRNWPSHDAATLVASLLVDSPLGIVLRQLSRPLIAFYQPSNDETVIVSGPRMQGVARFLTDGTNVGLLDGLVVATCTDGKKDACCAKFGLPVFRAFTGCVDVQVLEISHLGGCRFAPTAICLPSGHCYGRLNSNQISAVVEAERAQQLVPEVFRGTIYGTELDCWALKVWQERFGYTPALDCLSYSKEGITVRVFNATDGESIVLTERTERIPLRSGCDNLAVRREVDRVCYELVQ